MATVGTLFVNIAAKTNPFIQGVRASMAKAKNMATQSGKALTAYGQTTRSIFTGEQTYTMFSRLSAAVYSVSPRLGMLGFRMERFGILGAKVAGNVGKAFGGLSNALGFGKFTGLASFASVGVFFFNITRLSISRFAEIRRQLYDITRQWRVISIEASRAFAPAVSASLALVKSKLDLYFNDSKESMVGMAQAGMVIVGIFATLVDVVRMLFNALQILARLLLSIGTVVSAVVEGITDFIGLTDSSTNVSWDMTKDLIGGISGDWQDMKSAGSSIGDTWSRVYGGMQSVEAGPGASGLTESGYGGSGALIDEARRQNAQLARIEHAILNTGGLR